MAGGTVKINMETRNGELRDEVQVGVETGEVCREENFRGKRGKLGVGRGELLLEGGCAIENKDGLVNLDPFSTSILEVRQKFGVNRKEFWKKGNGLETRLGALGGLAKDKERDGTEDDRTGGNASSLSLIILLKGFVEVQLEVGFLRELRDDKVVVGVEPKKANVSGSHIKIIKARADLKKQNVPFLHF